MDKIRMMKTFLFAFLLPFAVYSQSLKEIEAGIQLEYPELEKFYRHMHANPELSLKEKQTSENIAAVLRKAGYDVTSNVGGYGVVAVKKNGDGPVVMFRADMDALPVKELSGSDFASNVRATTVEGLEANVMHACGHDVHTTVMLGTAELMMSMKDKWKGTLIFIAQPGEEGYLGAAAMIKDGLYTRFPKPDFVLGLHVNPELPTGTFAYREGYAMAGSMRVNVTVKGIGGHAAFPNLAKDPVLLASEIVMALQTIVSRELPPDEAAVLSVTMIHGGDVVNVIPSVVELGMTIRYPNDEIRDKMLNSIERICKGAALGAGLPENLMPEVRYDKNKSYIPLYNDPVLARRVGNVFRRAFGPENVRDARFVTWAEDFAFYRHANPEIPTFFYFLGANDPDFIKSVKGKDITRLDAVSAGRLTLHSPYFMPAYKDAITTGIEAMSLAAFELLKK